MAALLASAGVMSSGAAAQAADLSGNCCADLEERVAELEATAARKGNRKVSLQIYGQVTESIIWWNDGAETNAYVNEDYLSKNRVGFRGSAKISNDWSAGFLLELGIRAYRSSNSNQLALGATNNLTITTYNTQSVSLRQANWYLDSQTYGRITVGRTNDAAAGTSTISLVEPYGFSGMTGPGYISNGYFLRRSGTTGNTGLSALNWGDTANIRNGDGPATFSYAETAAAVKYTSPFFLGQSKSTGFQFEAMWGMDDMWSVALRYAETWGAFRFAAGVGYGQWSAADRGMCSLGAVGNAINALSGGSNPTLTGAPAANAGSNMDCNSIQASASLMHVPTGLYVSGGGAQINDRHSQDAFDQASGLPFGGPNRPGDDPKTGIWWVQGGWQAKLNPLGNTIFWAQWVQYDNGFGVRNSIVQTVDANDVINSLGNTALLGGAQTKYWGIGVSQEITAAAMVLYAGFHNGSTDIVLVNQSPTATNQRAKSNPIDDFQTFYTGAIIRF